MGKIEKPVIIANDAAPSVGLMPASVRRQIAQLERSIPSSGLIPLQQKPASSAQASKPAASAPAPAAPKAKP